PGLGIDIERKQIRVAIDGEYDVLQNVGHPTTSWPKIQLHIDEVVAAVNQLRPGEFREMVFSI
ncbi:MAG TPA: hypothetical protein VLV54_15180, partial [Thermoanaerobaculia bacterium]|nr:hypothetical protein [Thermoanaerobaculia bacterium]